MTCESSQRQGIIAVPHETVLISTIAVSLAYAFLGGFAAYRLRLPPLVGYLLAGIAVRPFTPGFVADARLAGELAAPAIPSNGWVVR